MNIRDVLIDHLLNILKEAIISQEPTILSELQVLVKRLEDMIQAHYPALDKPKC